MEDRTLLSPGDLDPTFGSGGLVTTPGPNYYLLLASRVAVQDDGHILVAATLNYIKGVPMVRLVRYETDGRLDASFGSNGLVDVPGSVSHQGIVGLALQPDGRILVTHGINGFRVTRLTPDGRADPSFGSSGTAGTTFPGYPSAHPSVVAVQPDGSILLGGSASDSSGDSFALARFTANGRLDTSFGNQGGVLTPFPGQSVALATGLTLQPDGNIVVAGETWNTPSNYPQRFALARYDSSGHLDPSFGTNGLVATAFPGFSNASAGNDVAVQSDGGILLAGWVSNGFVSYRFGLARYDSDGSLDGSFGSGGLVTTSFPGFSSARAYGMTVQPNGRILVVGGAYASGSLGQFGLARYDSDGSLDGSFGSGGLVTTSFGDHADVWATDVTVQSDGRIVAAGTTGYYAVARYEGDAPAATHFDISRPAEVTAGQPFDVTVTARDDNGNVVPDYTGTVTLSSTDPLAPDLGSHPFTTADGGVFTFTAIRVFTAGPQSLLAADGSLRGQADLVVLPGEAVQILLSASDEVLAGVTAGTPFTVTLTAYDAWGNVATGYRGVVSFVSNDPNAVLPTDYQFSPDDGGSHDFTITLGTPGPVRLTAIDTDSLMLSYLDLNVT